MKAYKRIRKLTEVVYDLIKDMNNEVVIADVGADHGYLSESLSRIDKVQKIYAIEISNKCLEKVIKLKQNFNLHKIEPVLSDGLTNIEKVNLSVLAGIGGYETINIIKNQNNNGKNKCGIFVLQPSDNLLELKNWINQNKFLVIRDFVFESAKRFYPVIVVDVTKKQECEMTEFDFYLGRDNSIKDKEFVNYLYHLSGLLDYLNNLINERILTDKTLVEKQKIKCLIENLLKDLK